MGQAVCRSARRLRGGCILKQSRHPAQGNGLAEGGGEHHQGHRRRGSVCCLLSKLLPAKSRGCICHCRLDGPACYSLNLPLTTVLAQQWGETTAVPSAHVGQRKDCRCSELVWLGQSLEAMNHLNAHHGCCPSSPPARRPCMASPCTTKVPKQDFAPLHAREGAGPWAG